MKRSFLAVALALETIACVLPIKAQTKAHRVLFALTSPEEADWQLTLNNVRNLESGLVPDAVEVEVVAYGPGTAFLKKDGPVAARNPEARSGACPFRGLRQCDEEATS